MGRRTRRPAPPGSAIVSVADKGGTLTLRETLSGKKFILAPLLATAVGAVLFHGRSYVGFYNDDASFVLLARRLWDALHNLSAAGLAGNFTHFLPGYPIFLAPFAAALKPHWGLLRWTTAGLSLITVYGFWRLLEGWLGEEERRWAVLLYAIHPLFLMSSGLVMADPFLTCLFVYGLLGLRLVLEGEPGVRGYALLLCMAAWAAAAKPIGILLPAALTAGLIAARSWKALRLVAALVWLPLLGAALYAALKSGTPTDYVGYLLHGLASLAQYGLWERIYNLFYSFVLLYGLATPWPSGPFYDATGALLIAGVIFLCVRGLSALLARPAPGRFVALSAWLLLLGQGLVMSLWTVYSERYALPMLPLGALFLVPGIFSLRKVRPAVARAVLAAAALGFLGYSGWLAVMINSERRPIDSRLCSRTLDWIRDQTPPDSRFSGSGALVYLYTGRSGHGLSAAPDLDLFISYLYRLRITHALVNDLQVLSTKGPYRTNHALQKAMERDWIRSHPGLFKKLYSSPEERTEIYAVNFPPGWGKASELYGRALRELQASDPRAATASLRLALAEVPDFPSALLTLASVRMLHGGDPAEAERLLRRVLALEPNCPPASRKLADMLESGGRKREAAQVREAARAALSRPPFNAVP